MTPETAIIFIVALILSVIIHEVAHGYAANWLGDPTARLSGRLTLNPIPHIDPMGSVVIPGLLLFSGTPFLFGWAKPVPYNPYNLRNQKWGEAIVAAAGPGVNILIALIFSLVVRLGNGVLDVTFIQVAAFIAFINILLALFNMIPVPPLDGSKVLSAFLPYHLEMKYREFAAMMERLGIAAMFIFIFLLIFVFGDYFFGFVSFIFTFFTGLSGIGL